MAGRAAPVERRPDQLGVETIPLFEKFLDEFNISSEDNVATSSLPSPPEYHTRLSEMVRTDTTTLYIDYTHIQSFSESLSVLILDYYLQLEPYLCIAIQNFVLRLQPEYAKMKHAAVKPFHISVYNMMNIASIRDLRTARIGQLMSMSGTVTRTSPVRPELLVAYFICQDCRTANSGIRQQFKYTEPLMCTNPQCTNRSNWQLDTSQSQFVDWQMLRIQENANEIPAGSMPRSVKIILRHEIVEQAKPGDKCVFTGTLIVVPDIAQLNSGAGAAKLSRQNGGAQRQADNGSQGITGLKSLGVRDLTYKLVFLANNVRSSTAGYGVIAREHDGSDKEVSVTDEFTESERARIIEMKQTPRLYSRMIQSVAPTIFGHDEIKRGILLMLFGGVHKSTLDKQNLRGDINVCIVGDPSTSKSQFLKYVCEIVPRSVYTSGKASSAAGLTASVVRDPETGEFAIEAGALMLADNGICCIDEFDKMDIKDQVAIHEAMEQQTISITKAGIQATLNARTSILAAANPMHGRYDKSRTLKQNVDISAPIMSRFDLFFVVLDEQDEMIDYNIARHIVNTHAGHTNTSSQPEFSTTDIQTYLRFAKSLKPQIAPESKKLFMDYYVQLRTNDSTGSNRSAYRITVRQLESMVRLAEARARLELSEWVTPQHVKEAARLLKKSIVHVEQPDIELDPQDDTDHVDTSVNGGGGGGNDDHGPNDGADHPMGESDTKPAAPATSTNDKIEMSFDEYRRITNLLVLHMRKMENDENPGMKQGDLVAWYLHELEQDGLLDTEQDVRNHHKRVSLVIQRLIKKDHVLQVIKKSKDENTRILCVHPNYDPDSATTSQSVKTKSSAESTAAAAEITEEEEEAERKQKRRADDMETGKENKRQTRQQQQTQPQEEEEEEQDVYAFGSEETTMSEVAGSSKKKQKTSTPTSTGSARKSTRK